MSTDTDVRYPNLRRGGKPGRSGPPGNLNAMKCGESVVHRDLKLLTTLALDLTSEPAQRVAGVREQLLNSLGGEDNLSAQQLLLVGEAAFLVLQLTAVNSWLAALNARIISRRKGINPVVLQRLALLSSLRGVLNDLGLERRARDVDDSLEAEAAAVAGNGHHAAQEHAGSAQHTPAGAEEEVQE